AGATFPFPLYSLWADDYDRLCSVEINYQSIGSGGGQRQFIEKTVDFGASDGIMSQDNEQRAAQAGGPVLHIPMTSGAVAVTFNLPGFNRAQDRGRIKLTPDVLADIYLGKIQKWNDPRIAALNSDLTLANRDILVVHRSDGSGTTWIFANYLSKVSADWKDKVGFDTSVQWPADALGRGVGGRGNEGVSAAVRQNPGAIGYVELAYALQNNMVWAGLRNKAGDFVEPSVERTTAAAQGVILPDDMKTILTDSQNREAYPIVGFTWLLVYLNQPDPAEGRALAHFLWWAVHEGQKSAPELQYAPLSQDALQKVEAQIRSIKCGTEPCLKG
ncbi:MAG TPA: phosphate ABC transporter substrate-binding protein PstS, partial [Dehalococcoidia bacterium]|nr:phosphate ABC transporter substrate-binding protein PstS [Dehalococcoidia bacterium]